MHWLAALVFLVHLVTPFAASVPAQTAPQITDLGVEHRFGETITFRVRVEPVDTVQELLVFITPDQQATVWQKITLDQGNSTGEFIQVVDARQIPLSPFSTFTYHYEASLKDGEKISSDPKSYRYDDNRFKWQTLNSGPFEIAWNSPDLTQGQEIADIAKEGLSKAQTLLDVQPPTPLRIYAYASSRDLQSALQLTNRPWVAGHASPELGMVLIAIPAGPEKKLEMNRLIPHEIMHILQYQVMGENYSKQPAWLVEGTASLAELADNPDYRTLLESAARSKQLIPMNNLCVRFPAEAGPQIQSYAQSESFARFLYEKYGASGLRSLIDQYRNGVGCEEGVSAAFGSSLDQLEYRWQQEMLGLDVGGLVLSNLSPILLLGLVILIPALLAFFPYRTLKTRPQEK